MCGGDSAPPHLSAALPIRPCREGVEKVLGSLILSSEELAYGRTKIFIRSPRTVSQEVRCPTWWGGMWSAEKEEGSTQCRTGWCPRKAPPWKLSAGRSAAS